MKKQTSNNHEKADFRASFIKSTPSKSICPFWLYRPYQPNI